MARQRRNARNVTENTALNFFFAWKVWLLFFLLVVALAIMLSVEGKFMGSLSTPQEMPPDFQRGEKDATEPLAATMASDLSSLVEEPQDELVRPPLDEEPQDEASSVVQQELPAFADVEVVDTPTPPAVLQTLAHTVAATTVTTTIVVVHATGNAPPLVWPDRLSSMLSSVQRPKSAIELGVGCRNCCTDGEKHIPCFDVEACAVGAPTGGRYAFVYAHSGRPGWPWLTFLDSLRAQTVELAAETGGTVDIVVMMTATDMASLSCRQRTLVKQYSIRLVEIPWLLPPDCWYPKEYWWPGKADGWCGPQDLMRLHVLGLDEYNAVVFYDQDIEFQGSVREVLRCAAKGHFISASGGAGEPLNVGFFALRPDRRLLRAAEIFAANATFSVKKGWNDCYFLPSHDKFVGAECGQGFFHTMFYNTKCKPARRALAAAGLLDSKGNMELKSVQIDRCIWNYQDDGDCGGNSKFKCEYIRGHHKPTSKPKNYKACGKFKFKEGAAAVVFPKPAPVSVGAGSAACTPQCVSIGSHCKCSGPGPNNVKVIDVQGQVKECDSHTASNSGDRFSVRFAGSRITVTRIDTPSCWCDDIDVQCCISAAL